MMILAFLFSFLLNNGPSPTRIDELVQFAQTAEQGFSYGILIDMSQPSTEKRLYLVDLATKKVIFTTYTAHGKGSGNEVVATRFSDVPGSLCTSLGKYKVGKNYKGKHGDSFQLIGLENSNANALDRAIVIHSAWYAEEGFIKKNGRCGNSWGCPAVAPAALAKLKPYLQKDVVVWIYR